MRPSSLPEHFLVDAHVHLTGEAALESVRSAGIAAIRDAGSHANASSPDHGPGRGSVSPLIIRSLWAIYKQGGYGARFGVALNTKSDIVAELVRLKKAGTDIIKVMASGMVSLDKPDTVTAGGFDEKELTFIVEQARMLGLTVMAHANGELAITAAARAGVRSIEHGFFMTVEALDILAKKGIFWIPTIGALRRAASKAGKGYLINEVIDGQLRMVKHAYEIGVPLAIGTDCVLPDVEYKAAYDEEVACFTQAGISRDEVMKIARDGGARLLGIL